MNDGKLRMSVPLNGKTTSGAKNPRTELSQKYHWPISSSNESITVTLTVIKTIPDVNFDIGQILRETQRRIYSEKYPNGKKCPLHLMVEY